MKKILCTIIALLVTTQALAISEPIYIEESALRDTQKAETSMTPHLVKSLSKRVGVVEQIIAIGEDIYVLDRRSYLTSAYDISWRKWTWHLQVIRDGKIEAIADLTEDRGYYVDQDMPYISKTSLKDAHIAKDGDILLLALTMSYNGQTIGLISEVKDGKLVYRANTPFFKSYDDADIGSFYIDNGEAFLLVAPWPIYDSRQWLWKGSNGIMKEANVPFPHLYRGESTIWRSSKGLEIAYLYMSREISRLEITDQGLREISSLNIPIVQGKFGIRSIGDCINWQDDVFYTRLYAPYLYRENKKFADLDNLKHVTALYPSSRGFYVYDALEEAIYNVY